MKTLLSEKAYLILKWLCILCLPALAVFVKTVFPVWNIGYAEEISTTIMAVDVLLGALIGISTAQYNASKENNNEY